MRPVFFILFLFSYSLAWAQDTLNLEDLYTYSYNDKWNAKNFIDYGFIDQNVYLTHLIYKEGELFTGTAKAEHINLADEYGSDVTFITDIENGEIQKVAVFNSFGCTFRFFTIKNEMILNNKILARDTVFVFDGSKFIIKYTDVFFTREEKRFHAVTSYPLSVYDNFQTYSYGFRLQHSEYSPSGKSIQHFCVGNREFDTRSKITTLDTLIYPDVELHEYDSIGNHKYKRIAFYKYDKVGDTSHYNWDDTRVVDYYNWGDTLQARWYKNDPPQYDTLTHRHYVHKQLQYAALKNGVIREWYQNGQMKSEEMKNEADELEVRRWKKNGQLIQEK